MLSSEMLKVAKGIQATNVDLTTNLIAHYLLNNNADDSYGTYDGTGINGVDFHGDTANNDGTADRGIDFSGTSSISEYTLSFWIKLNSFVVSDMIIDSKDKADTTHSAGDITVKLGSDGSILYYFDRYNGSTYASIGTNSGVIQLDTLHHIIIKGNIESHQIYVDNVSEADSTVDASRHKSLNINSLVALYKYDTNTNIATDGLISNVRIYSDAKDQTFIDALYNEGYYPKPLPLPTTVGLVAHYPLTGTAEDTTGNYDGVENNITYVDDEEFGSVLNQGSATSNITVTGLPTFNSTNITFAVWIKYDIAPSVEYAEVFEIVDSGRTNLIALRHINGSLGYYGFGFHNGTEWATIPFSTSPDFNDADWHFVAFSWDGTTNTDAIRIQYDEDVVLTSSNNALGVDITKLVIGNIFSNYSNSNLHNLRIYNIKPSNQDFQDIYNYEKNFRPIDIDDGLIAYYPLASNSKDNYYNEHDATDTSMTYDGLSGVFNDTNSAIYTSISSDISSGDVTFSIWGKVNTSPTDIKYMVADRNNTYGNRGIALTTSDRVIVFSRDSSGVYKEIEHIFAANEILESHLYTFVQEGNIIILYIDGEFNTQLDMLSTVSFDIELAIGADPKLNRYNFDGKLSKVRIYNKALTAEQIEVIYNTEKDDYV